MYSPAGNMTDASICGAYMGILPPYMPVKYFAYMPYLVGTFVSGTYLTITCEVDIAVLGVLAYVPI